jgi:tetratricopeptide (TPR) repeat protein
MTVRIRLAATLGLWLMTQCPAAHADPAAAEALFREGRALLQRGELAPACEKLEASNALDPSAGTLLNLAACRLKQGRTATAWAHFLSAERLAQNQSRAEQASEAKRRALELEPQLSTLTLLAPAAPPGLQVRRMGQVVQSASLGMAVPVDPGPIVIEATAPGYESVRLEVTLGASADRRVLEIPPLRRSPARVAVDSSSIVGSGPAVREAPPAPRPSNALPWLIGGTGGAALLAGGVLGALALSSNSEAIQQCDAGNSHACRETQNRRDGQALASTVCVGAGLVGVGVGVVWLLTGNSRTAGAAWSYQGQVTRDSALLRMRVGF